MPVIQSVLLQETKITSKYALRAKMILAADSPCLYMTQVSPVEYGERLYPDEAPREFHYQLKVKVLSSKRVDEDKYMLLETPYTNISLILLSHSNKVTVLYNRVALNYTNVTHEADTENHFTLDYAEDNHCKHLYFSKDTPNSILLQRLLCKSGKIIDI